VQGSGNATVYREGRGQKELLHPKLGEYSQINHPRFVDRFVGLVAYGGIIEGRIFIAAYAVAAVNVPEHVNSWPGAFDGRE